MLNTRIITQEHQVNTGAEPMKPYHHFRYLIAEDIRRPLRLASLLGIVVLAFICTAPAYAGTTQILLTSPFFDGGIPLTLTSYSQNASSSGNGQNTSPSGNPAGRNVPGVCGQVTITKLIDRTSPLFLQYVLAGNTVIPQLTISFSQQSGTTLPFTYYTIMLENVFPTSITQSDNTTDIITEQIVLSAGRFRFRFFGQNPDGSPRPPVTFGFDCVTQSAF